MAEHNRKTDLGEGVDCAGFGCKNGRSEVFVDITSADATVRDLEPNFIRSTRPERGQLSCVVFWINSSALHGLNGIDMDLLPSV